MDNLILKEAADELIEERNEQISKLKEDIRIAKRNKYKAWLEYQLTLRTASRTKRDTAQKALEDADDQLDNILQNENKIRNYELDIEFFKQKLEELIK